MSEEKLAGVRETKATLLGLDTNRFVVSEFDVNESINDIDEGSREIDDMAKTLDMAKLGVHDKKMGGAAFDA